MKPKHLLAAVPAALLILATASANAGQTINEAGVLVCVNDKWDEKEVEKGHKLVDYAGRCVTVPTDQGAEKVALDCVGKYEYMPDSSWKGSGTCTNNYKDGKLYESFEEGSHLKEYTTKYTGGTGKYEGASGTGTYFYDQLTDTLAAGTYKHSIETP
jgi:hypothetical protein